MEINKYNNSIFFKGPCGIENCDWRNWSSWSGTCGGVQRTRDLRKYVTYRYGYDCVELQAKDGCQEMGNTTETQTVTKNPCT